MNTFEAESLVISCLLDEMGYGGNMIKYRRGVYKAVGQFYLNESSYMVVSGSRAEGISRVLESDRDYMSVYRHATCAEFHSTSGNDSNSSVLVVEREHSPPGYTLLKVQRNNRTGPPDLLNESSVKLGESAYLSSACWKYNTLQRLTESLKEIDVNRLYFITGLDYSGPSVSSISETTNMKDDTVAALECECLTLFSDYEARRRHFDWPSYNLKAAVAGTRIHVVPTGMDDSPFQYLEWRICCTEGEMLLIQHLNPCYVKALILLKRIMKLTLKPIWKEMTSYVAKNIILWLAETTDSTRVSDSKLVVVFQAAFKLLKTCIWRNRLPSYMIPLRNIFAGRLSRTSSLCARIDFLLKEGPGAILRYPTIRHLLQMKYYAPETLRRDLLEHRKMEIYILMAALFFARNFASVDLFNISADELTRRIFFSKDFVSLFQFLVEIENDSISGLEVAAHVQKAVYHDLPCCLDGMARRFPLLFDTNR